MVEFTDGSVKAQLGNADMHTPISYALLYPERSKEAMESFSILDYPTLTFLEVDRVKYPALDIAYESLSRGGTAPCTMNGANEVAVAAFLNHKCSYLDIVGAINKVRDGGKTGGCADLFIGCGVFSESNVFFKSGVKKKGGLTDRPDLFTQEG